MRQFGPAIFSAFGLGNGGCIIFSTLNIAQMKEKYGIKERENYNHAKKDDAIQPGCT